jgi:hypothetical protein
MQSKTFRLFISSTFSDLIEERDVLHNEVFPIVKKYCTNLGYNFIPIDLRWGVTHEAGLDHKAMDICIDEVNKLRDYPMPNFLILLGNRYGWIPVPNKVDSKEFEMLCDASTKEEQQLLKKWFFLDTNIQPSVFCLQAVSIDKQDEWYRVTEQKIVKIFVKNKQLFSNQLIFRSATEQEVVTGVFKSVNQMDNHNENVLCVSRSLKNNFNIDKYLDDDKLNLKKLKNKIKGSIDPKVEVVELNSELKKVENEYRLDKEYLELFAQNVKRFLLESIEREILRLEKIQKKSNPEQYHHKVFKDERSSIFVGREDQLCLVNKYLENDLNKQVFVVHGESGVGKSAFMSKVASNIEENIDSNKTKFIYRFIGITDKSALAHSLLVDICDAIEDQFEINNEMLSNTYDEVVTKFLYLLTKVSQSSKKLILLIDALDQFTSQDTLEWIEDQLPNGIKIIVSTLPNQYGNYIDKLKLKTNQNQNFVEVKKLKKDDGRVILNKWLVNEKHHLTKDQEEYILDLFKENGLPLYLKIIFDEALKWHSYTTDYRYIKNSLTDSIRYFFTSLVKVDYHSDMLVRHTLGYLSASNKGLNEYELTGILSDDHIVMNSISNEFHDLPVSKNLHKLPSAVWSRLFFDLKKYLITIDADGVSILNYYHRQFKEASRDYYYEVDSNFYHSNIMEYFWVQDNFTAEGKIVNTRRLSELPYHCIKSGSISKIIKLLSSNFINLKTINIGKNYLLDDIYSASEVISSLPDKIKDEYLLSLSQALIDYLVNIVNDPFTILLNKINVEDIHSYFIYRKNQDFYKIFLTEIQKNNHKGYSISFKARYANKIRREAKLHDSWDVYESMLQHNELDSLDLVEQSRVYYDMGYIKYLMGEGDDAIAYMKQSADIASKGSESKVSEYISKCLEYRLRYLFDKCNVSEFERVLDEAKDIFEENKLISSNAKRWIKNVIAHKFEVAYELKNTEIAKKYLELYRLDEWMIDHEANGKYSSFTPYEARYQILLENYEDAAKMFKGYLYKVLGDKRDKRESVVRDYYDYCYALKRSKNDLEFEEQKDIALRISKEPGNHIWHNKLKNLK